MSQSSELCYVHFSLACVSLAIIREEVGQHSVPESVSNQVLVGIAQQLFSREYYGSIDRSPFSHCLGALFLQSYLDKSWKPAQPFLRRLTSRRLFLTVLGFTHFLFSSLTSHRQVPLLLENLRSLASECLPAGNEDLDNALDVLHSHWESLSSLVRFRVYIRILSQMQNRHVHVPELVAAGRQYDDGRACRPAVFVPEWSSVSQPNIINYPYKLQQCTEGKIPTLVPDLSRLPQLVTSTSTLQPLSPHITVALPQLIARERNRTGATPESKLAGEEAISDGVISALNGLRPLEIQIDNSMKTMQGIIAEILRDPWTNQSAQDFSKDLGMFNIL